MSSYAQWPSQQPPRPPQRPSFWAWQQFSDAQRDEYVGQLGEYLWALRDDPFMITLADMAIWWKTCHEETGILDPAWKRKKGEHNGSK